jgi:chemotaxis protein methyltransferase WspC
MAKELREIEELLASRIGLDSVSVGPSLILRAVERRMGELGLSELGAYGHLVRQSESELQALIEEVVIPESWFFRDERPFQCLREIVRERWLARPARAPLRALSVPCAGGEEPYSIAMTLSDLGLSPDRFRIDAVDVSDRRLAIARRGVYSANAFRGPDLSYRSRHFREHSEGYELDPEIRRTVQFVRASVLDPHLLEGSPPYDVLFCRNLLIYLGAAARGCVITAIDRLLAQGGLLFLGHADRLDSSGAGPKFTSFGDPGCFAYRRTPEEDVQTSRTPPEPLRATSALTAGGTTSAGIPTSVGVLSAPAPATSETDPGIGRLLPSRAGFEPSLLGQAAELANQGRFDEAVAACQRHLRHKGHSASAYYLMGMICQAAGNIRLAEDCFFKTVYLDPGHDEALLALALLAERRGDHAAAAGFRRRAERTMTTTRNRAT